MESDNLFLLDGEADPPVAKGGMAQPPPQSFSRYVRKSVLSLNVRRLELAERRPRTKD